MMKSVRNTLERNEFFFDYAYEARVIKVSGCGNNHIVRHKTLSVEVEELLLLKRADRILCAQNGFAQRIVLPEILGKKFVDQVIRIVLVHLDFFKDHTFFAVDVLFGEDRIQDQIAQNIYCNRQV